jgi:hypothetical protein
VEAHPIHLAQLLERPELQIQAAVAGLLEIRLGYLRLAVAALGLLLFPIHLAHKEV